MSLYSAAAWKRLGAAIQAERIAQKMSTDVLGYIAHSSAKSILRIEQGRVYGNRRDAPPADYNSEKYVLKRLRALEIALGWEQGTAAAILDPASSITK